jgi:hypothetical protein
VLMEDISLTTVLFQILLRDEGSHLLMRINLINIFL